MTKPVKRRSGASKPYIRTERVQPSLESRVLTTLRMSALSAAQIGERLGRPTSSVLDALNALTAKGVVAPVNDDAPRRWKIKKEST